MTTTTASTELPLSVGAFSGVLIVDIDHTLLYGFPNTRCVSSRAPQIDESVKHLFDHSQARGTLPFLSLAGRSCVLRAGTLQLFRIAHENQFAIVMASLNPIAARAVSAFFTELTGQRIYYAGWSEPLDGSPWVKELTHIVKLDEHARASRVLIADDRPYWRGYGSLAFHARAQFLAVAAFTPNHDDLRRFATDAKFAMADHWAFCFQHPQPPLRAEIPNGRNPIVLAAPLPFPDPDSVETLLEARFVNPAVTTLILGYAPSETDPVVVAVSAIGFDQHQNVTDLIVQFVGSIYEVLRNTLQAIDQFSTRQ